ncbi:SMI1/KNR4 family protein [Streptomyces malaysiense]|uniref:Knr4/Smi1-like domain-containing protein n=1 Tax=Streptomyces malaysiense TaxID=1428626 RepID=A0A1J4Q6G3_9ACTN|nr:hypothetical protein [Streptomyces malaysiense]OIK28116.1 hypothetical protein VT52_007625 [Streptomyces malaysiense]
MSAPDALIPLLGQPSQRNIDTFETLERKWGVAFPREYVEFGRSYGDSTISEFIFVCGPKTLESYAERMSSRMERNPFVPRDFLPTKDGMLLWGNTVEGDQLFLVDRGNSEWNVAAFRRNWSDWYESELTLVEWLHLALTGQIASDWLPEWPKHHTLSPMED